MGRDAYLHKMDRLAGSVVTQGAARIMILSGAPGVGKSGLAVHWGHRSRYLFPDGQLYADFKGGQARDGWQDTPLATFLRTYGVASDAIPSCAVEQSALFRTIVADLRTLIVLDGVCQADQVHPLLPPTAGSVVLVTSQHPLSALVAQHDAHPIEVDPLSIEGAVRLLQELIGARALADVDATHRLADLCHCMPRTLREAAEFVIGEPTRSLRSLLADAARRIST
jgi:hypothetical protein